MFAMNRLSVRSLVPVLGLLVAASCSSSEVSSPVSSTTVVASVASETSDSLPPTPANSGTSTTLESSESVLDSDDPTLALDHTAYAPSSDAFAPSVMPDSPMGRVGYTRYVFTQSGDQVIPALVEGPKGSQTRCQVAELPCSFQDLKALFDSGEPVPSELNMTSMELGILVRQLGQVQELSLIHI